MMLVTTILAGGVPAAIAQNLVAGGLTALPPVQLSSNLAQNPGFESNSGGVPTGWTGGGGWALFALAVGLMGRRRRSS